MKETNINDLNTQLTEEESSIVDSIINDLNSDTDKNSVPQQGMPQQGIPQGMPQQGMPQQGMPQGMPQQGMPQGMPQQKILITPEQKTILETLSPEEQQKFLKNLKMKQMDENKELNNNKIKEIENNVIEQLKNKIKEPLLISLIAFIFSIPQINKLFELTKINLLINEDGTITILSVLIKSILIGVIYFLIKKYNLI